MEKKTLDQLRKLARSLGIKGYSKLRKQELAQQIIHTQAKTSAAGTASTVKTPSASKAVRAATPAKPSPREARPGPPPPQGIGDEEQVENAKFAVTPPGLESPRAESAADLGEDIDRLPEIDEPVVRLLAQQPGVLHGYWVLPPGAVARQADLKLRLSVVAGDALALLEEFDVTQDRGNWYFHVDQTLSGAEVYLQLGHYDANRQFVSTIRRGTARIPNLYAANDIDRQWWVSEERFRTMYLRSGGFARGEKLGWPGSSSS